MCCISACTIKVYAGIFIKNLSSLKHLTITPRISLLPQTPQRLFPPRHLSLPSTIILDHRHPRSQTSPTNAIPQLLRDLCLSIALAGRFTRLCYTSLVSLGRSSRSVVFLADRPVRVIQWSADQDDTMALLYGSADLASWNRGDELEFAGVDVYRAD